MKFNAHARIEIAIAAALLLGSCGKMPHSFTGEDYDQLDVADVNVRNIELVDSLEGRVSDLESKLGK